MGQRVQWWDDLSETLTVVGCAMWQTVQKLIDNDEAKMRLQEHYPRCHDDVFYLLRRRNVDELIWLPQRSLKLIREDVERPTVAWNDERHSYELTRQYRIEIPTPDGEPIQLGAKVATKRIGVTLVASLVGMLWRRSELAAYFAEEYGEMWDMNGPDWRNSDLCLLMPSGSLATEMAQNGDSETPFNHGVDGPTAIVHPAIDLEVF